MASESVVTPVVTPAARDKEGEDYDEGCDV
jgi:hypothetical protein